MKATSRRYLTTKELPAIIGLSVSFFEKGRIYGYGPPYYKQRGRILYKESEVVRWAESQRVDPEGWIDG